MAKRVFGLVMVIGLLAITSGYGMDDFDLVLRIRNLALKVSGAGPDTQTRLFTKEGQELLRTPIELTSGEIFAIGDTPQGVEEEFTDRVGIRVAGSWSAELADYSYYGVVLRVYGIENPLWVQINKDYQDLKIEYALFIDRNESEIVDQLRTGQKVSLTFEFTGLRINRYGGQEGHEVFGHLVGVKPETTMLSCENGHEYAPSAGFRFCPQCGEPLE